MSRPYPRFRWRRTTAIAMRPAAGAEASITARHTDPHWIFAQGLLAAPQHPFVVCVDTEIGARYGLTQGSFCGDHFPNGDRWTARQAIGSFEPTPRGRWALSCGLWIDPRHFCRLSAPERTQLLRLAGPLGSELFARRHGLDGVVSAVALRHLAQFTPALSARAYLQQVEAGAIDDPLLTAHLRHGARLIAIVDDTDPCFAILRWRRF